MDLLTFDPGLRGPMKPGMHKPSSQTPRTRTATHTEYSAKVGIGLTKKKTSLGKHGPAVQRNSTVNRYLLSNKGSANNLTHRVPGYIPRTNETGKFHRIIKQKQGIYVLSSAPIPYVPQSKEEHKMNNKPNERDNNKTVHGTEQRAAEESNINEDVERSETNSGSAVYRHDRVPFWGHKSAPTRFRPRINTNCDSGVGYGNTNLYNVFNRGEKPRIFTPWEYQKLINDMVHDLKDIRQGKQYTDVEMQRNLAKHFRHSPYQVKRNVHTAVERTKEDIYSRVEAKVNDRVAFLEQELERLKYEAMVVFPTNNNEGIRAKTDSDYPYIDLYTGKPFQDRQSTGLLNSMFLERIDNYPLEETVDWCKYNSTIPGNNIMYSLSGDPFSGSRSRSPSPVCMGGNQQNNEEELDSEVANEGNRQVRPSAPEKRTNAGLFFTSSSNRPRQQNHRGGEKHQRQGNYSNAADEVMDIGLIDYDPVGSTDEQPVGVEPGFNFSLIGPENGETVRQDSNNLRPGSRLDADSTTKSLDGRGGALSLKVVNEEAVNNTQSVDPKRPQIATSVILQELQGEKKKREANDVMYQLKQQAMTEQIKELQQVIMFMKNSMETQARAAAPVLLAQEGRFQKPLNLDRLDRVDPQASAPVLESGPNSNPMANVDTLHVEISSENENGNSVKNNQSNKDEKIDVNPQHGLVQDHRHVMIPRANEPIKALLSKETRAQRLRRESISVSINKRKEIEQLHQKSLGKPSIKSNLSNFCAKTQSQDSTNVVGNDKVVTFPVSEIVLAPITTPTLESGVSQSMEAMKVVDDNILFSECNDILIDQRQETTSLKQSLVDDPSAIPTSLNPAAGRYSVPIERQKESNVILQGLEQEDSTTVVLKGSIPLQTKGANATPEKEKKNISKKTAQINRKAFLKKMKEKKNVLPIHANAGSTPFPKGGKTLDFSQPFTDSDLSTVSSPEHSVGDLKQTDQVLAQNSPHMTALVTAATGSAGADGLQLNPRSEQPEKKRGIMKYWYFGVGSGSKDNPVHIGKAGERAQLTSKELKNGLLIEKKEAETTKRKIKMEIKEWETAFNDREGRPPSKRDKATIKQLYLDYQAAAKAYESTLDKLAFLQVEEGDDDSI